MCERWVETGTDSYIDPTSSPDHSSTSSASWLGLHLHIFFHNAHLLPLLLPLIYTGASLIDGSVKGQYTTATLHILARTVIHCVWEQLSHFLCGTDLAPLISSCLAPLRGTRFSSDHKGKSTVRKWLKHHPKGFYTEVHKKVSFFFDGKNVF